MAINIINSLGELMSRLKTNRNITFNPLNDRNAMRNSKISPSLAQKLLTFMVDSGHEYSLNDVRMLLKSHSINYQEDERPHPQKKSLVEKIMKKYKVMRKQLKDYDSK
jgi:hypothetical protein